MGSGLYQPRGDRVGARRLSRVADDRSEVLFNAAKTDDMPRIFATENQNKVPAAALWLSNIIVQLFVISTLFSQDAFTLALKLCSSMSLIPYLLVAGIWAADCAARRNL